MCHPKIQAPPCPAKLTSCFSSSCHPLPLHHFLLKPEIFNFNLLRNPGHIHRIKPLLFCFTSFLKEEGSLFSSPFLQGTYFIPFLQNQVKGITVLKCEYLLCLQRWILFVLKQYTSYGHRLSSNARNVSALFVKDVYISFPAFVITC